MPDSLQEQKTDLAIPTPTGPVARLLKSKPLLASSVLTSVTVAAKVFDLGTEAVDWMQRYEWLRDKDAFKVLSWVLSPTGLNVLLVLAIMALLLAVMWIVNKPTVTQASKWEPKPAAITNNTKPTIEILSPFDNDEVGLHETVRGRAFPPEQELQVVVFAGDKWYPQQPVSVKGSSWSVKCQFGNPNIPSGGTYKVVALLGNELKGGMWYGELPTGIPKSNIISVHRPEVTIEERVETLTAEKSKLERDLLAESRLRASKEDALEIKRQELAEVRTSADAQTNTYELTFKGMSEELKAAQSKAHSLDKDLTGKKQQMKEVQRERDRYKEEARSLKDQYDEEHQAAIRLKTLNEQYEKQIGNLKSDAEGARREKLAAASNLDGVETDRNNYRTWFNELSWLKPTIKEQQRDISNHVKVIAARPCLLNLKERVVIIDLVIRNDSFFDITIKGDTVTGRLSTEKNGLLHDPAKARADLIHHPIENLKPTKEATVALIQPLLKTEAEDIEDAIAADGGSFWLGNLNIPISVQNAEPLNIDSKPLRINSDVEHIYFREFGALTFDGEVITPRELLRNVEALPFPERARIYRELSKAYGESLWRLNEAKEKKDPEDLAQESINRNTKKT